MAKAKKQRGIRDEAGVGPDPRQVTHLVPLSELKKFKVADGEPDIRGWPVFASNGRALGTIHDLLIDTRLGQVAMVHVALEGPNRYTVAPIRAAWIDRDTKRVVLNEADFRMDVERAGARGAESREEAARPADHGAVSPAPYAEGEQTKEVRYATDADEVERRPVIMEEVVVRRREVDPSELTAKERENLRLDGEKGERPER